MSGWVELGERVYCRNYDSLDFNVGAVLGEEGLLIVDTRMDLVEARELHDDLREISPKPVLWVVDTHYHWDHAWGNAEFVPAQIWGHVRCAEVLRDHGEEDKATMAERMPEYAERFRAVTIVPPDHTFAETASIDVGGGRAVEMAYLGRAHTDSDIVIAVPDADVSFAGDLIENGAPPSFGDSFPLEWPDTLARAVEAISAGTVVPGHGHVVGRSFVETQLEEIREVARLARDHFVIGAQLERALDAAAPYPRDFMEHALRRAFAQLDGTLV